MNKNPAQIIAALKDRGCQIDEAMPRFLNDTTFYVTLLAQVPAEPAFEELGKQLKANDLKGAFESAHTLKGMLGNMGLTPLFDLACAIIEPLRIGKRDNVDSNYAKLMAKKDELFALLR